MNATWNRWTTKEVILDLILNHDCDLRQDVSIVELVEVGDQNIITFSTHENGKLPAECNSHIWLQKGQLLRYEEIVKKRLQGKIKRAKPLLNILVLIKTTLTRSQGGCIWQGKKESS